jgi:hypothetical protein
LVVSGVQWAWGEGGGGGHEAWCPVGRLALCGVCLGAQTERVGGGMDVSWAGECVSEC